MAPKALQSAGKAIEERGERVKQTIVPHDLQSLKYVYTQFPDSATDKNDFRRPGDDREKHILYNFDLICIAFLFVKGHFIDKSPEKDICEYGFNSFTHGGI